MVDVWPASLPQYLLVDGYSEGIGDGRLRSQTDTGPAKVRRRSSAIPRGLQGRMVMTRAQIGILQEFVEKTLLNGTLPFLLPDPLTRYPSLVRFAGNLPAWNSRGAVDFSVSLDLEVIYTMAPTTIVDEGRLLAGSAERNSTATYFDAAGILRTADNNVLRLDHDPVTGEPKGALIESAATNYLTNNTMVGAAVGAPGSLPAGWTAILNGLSREIVGVGIEDGINYCDIRLFGVPAETWAAIDLGAFAGVFTAGGAATVSMFVRRKAGSLANVANVSVNNRAYLTPSGVNDTTISISSALAAGDGTLRTARFEIANAPVGSITGVGNAFFLIEMTGAIDVTVRIGLPQMERGARATSPIKTTAAAATRAADIVSIPTSAFPFNPNEGTIVAEWSSNSPIEGPVANLDGGSKSAPPYLRMGVSSLAGGRILAEYAPGSLLSLDEGMPTGISQVVKAAFAYKGNEHAICTNGRAAKTAMPAVAASGFTRLLIGDAAWFTAPSCHIKRLVYFPYRLTNSELQEMTA